MNIVSFLPSSTEMVCALGLESQLVGITHECDYPETIRSKPIVVRSALPLGELTPEQIDFQVSQKLKRGQSLYTVDEKCLFELQPDLILTQDLCQVCAPSGTEVSRVLQVLPHPPRVLWLSPNYLSDIFANLTDIGEATGHLGEANRLVSHLRDRVKTIESRVHGAKTRPRVLFMEWCFPPYNAGHWVPELIEIAGGFDALGRKGNDSVRISWEEIVAYAPEIVLVGPCGYTLIGAYEQAQKLRFSPGWEELPAVKNHQVIALDSNSYFSRPGPRVIDGLELLASLIHPNRVTWNGPSDAYRYVEV